MCLIQLSVTSFHFEMHFSVALARASVGRYVLPIRKNRFQNLKLFTIIWGNKVKSNS
jgi:hypothetical protein